MKKLVVFCEALADPTRWRLLCLLRHQPLCVCELADILGLPQSTVSSHVQIIRRAELLQSERRGKWQYHQLKPALAPLIDGLANRFAAQPAQDARLRRDAAQAKRRLAKRAQSCCPLPRQLRPIPARKPRNP